ncbi:MAG: hypothetical protein V3T23_09865, partial [Nitrososphaerales archaeon]
MIRGRHNSHINLTLFRFAQSSNLPLVENATQPSILGAVDFSHTALADLLKNVVMRDGRADHGTHPHCATANFVQCYVARGLKAMG